MTSSSSPATALHILHFNDAYELESSKADAKNPALPVGGASRFGSLVDAFRADASARGADAVVFSSGDHFSPSLLSVITRGRHMVPILRELRVAAVCVGNHELDVGVAQAADLMAQCEFPWLLSNLRNRVTGQPLCNARESAIIEAGPWRIGVLGVVEDAWVDTLATVSPADLLFDDPLSTTLRIAAELRARGAHIVVALTHMRLVNDNAYRDALAVAEAQAGGGRVVDLILGGHDHEVSHVFKDDGPPIAKSGCDFRQVTRIVCSPPSAPAYVPSRLALLPSVPLTFVGALNADASAKFSFFAELANVTADIPLHEELRKIVAGFSNMIESKMKKVLGISNVALDCRFSSVRSRETNIGNMIADLMRRSVDADVALLNSGTLRADAILAPGLIRLKDLVSMLPFFSDTVVMVETSGATLLAALENAVCKWPQTEGRFCQVSGIKFAFDPSKPAGERVDKNSVLIVARRGGSRLAAARTPKAALSPLAARSHVEESKEAATPPSGVNSDEDILRDADDVPISTPHGGSAASPEHVALPPPTSDVSSPAFFLQVTSPISENAHSMPASPVHPAHGSLLPSGLRPSILRTHSMPGEMSASHSLFISSPQGSSGGSGTSRVAWKPLVLTKRYRVALKHYILQGKDGFTMMIPDQPGNDVRVLIDDHTGPVLPSLLRAHFKVLTAYTDGDVGSSLGDLERSNGIPLAPSTPLTFSSTITSQSVADSARVESGVAGLAASPRIGLRVSGLVRIPLDGGVLFGNSADSPTVSSPALSTIASAMSSVTLSDELDTLTAARGDLGPEHVRVGIATATPLGFGRTGEETASSIAALAANIRLDAPTLSEQHVNDYLKLNTAIGSPHIVNSESLANTGMAAVRIPLRLASAPGVLTTIESGTALRPSEPEYASTLTAIPFSTQGVSRAINAAQDAGSALSPAPSKSAPRSINASFSAAPKLDRVSAFLSADSEGDSGSVPRTPHLSQAPRTSYTVGAKGSRVGSDGLKTASALAIAPCIEGRITVIGFEHLALAAEAEATAYGRSHLGGQ